MKYALITNREKDPSGRCTEEAAGYLEKCGGEVLYLNTDDSVPKEADILVTFGGDGTLLHAAYQASEMDKPILGVNTGTLGYLTELEPSELSLLEKLEKGEYTVEKRMLLAVDVEREGKLVYHSDALNDVVCTHGEIMRVIPLSFSSDEIEIKRFRGDGIIASTPTGSTAYSLSAGGPVVDPMADSIILTPLSAHELRANSFVFSPERKLEIGIGDLENRSAFLSADGRDVFPLSSGDRVKLCRSPKTVSLIKLKEEGFFTVLYNKL